MKRLMSALAVGALVSGTVWGLAASLDVGFGTAASGKGDVAACAEVTGSTYVLVGQDVQPRSDQGGDIGTHTEEGDGAAVMSGNPTDITKTALVNIELPSTSACHGINLFVQLYSDDNGTTPIAGASGSCQVWPEGGLGWDEGSTDDNVPGCTVDIADTDVVPIESMRVTET